MTLENHDANSAGLPSTVRERASRSCSATNASKSKRTPQDGQSPALMPNGAAIR